MSLNFKTFEWSDKYQFKELEVIEGGPHRLYVVGDQKFPSMTSILKKLDEDSDWLDDWANRLPGGHAEAKKIVDDAVNRGNSLHELCELYLQNKLKREDVKGPGAMMFNRARRHLDKLKLIYAIESPVYSIQNAYAGRLDLLAVDEEDDFCICDHKNSRKPINVGRDYGRQKLFKYMLQCCGYSRAIYEMYGERPTHGKLFVSNHSTMDTNVFKFPLKPLDKDFQNLVDSFYDRADIKQNGYFKL